MPARVWRCKTLPQILSRDRGPAVAILQRGGRGLRCLLLIGAAGPGRAGIDRTAAFAESSAAPRL